MAGQLRTHPYFKTYDELQRSIKRMKTYREMNETLLEVVDQNRLDKMIEHMEEALSRVPEKYHVTKHYYQNKK